MSSVDDVADEPFKLNIAALQGRWMCEELGAALTVSGQAVQYLSGECYPIEVTPEGKLEIFGYKAIESKSDASSIIWKNKDTGKYLTWMYEGDSADQEPEVDTSLIIEGSGGRSSRKRKVDYAALDKELDKELAGGAVSKKSVWESQYAAMKSVGSSASGSQGPREEAIEACFKGLKRKFQTWVQSTDRDRFRDVLSKRGYLSTEIEYGSLPADVEASKRLVSYIISIGAKGMLSQSGHSISVRVSEAAWPSLLAECKDQPSSTSSGEVLKEVESIRDEIANFCKSEERSYVDKDRIKAILEKLERLPIDLEILKLTKIGVEVNKLVKVSDRAKQTLEHLKKIYLESKKQDH